MATYEITTPTGKYRITAPDEYGPEQIAALVRDRFGGQNQEDAPRSPDKPSGLSWSDVPGEALKNAPGSAVQFAKNVVAPFLEPVETAKALYDVGRGVASKAAGLIVNQDPQQKAETEAAADAVGQFFKDRYGSLDAIKNTLATDPIGAMGDTALVLTGGGAAIRGPGVVGQVGNAVRATGRAIDPLANAGRLVRGAGNVAAPILGQTTGAGALPVRAAFTAGLQSGATIPQRATEAVQNTASRATGGMIPRTAATPAPGGATAFTEAMRGQAPVRDVVDMAENAVGNLVRERGSNYRRGIGAIQNRNLSLSVRPINHIIRRGLDEVTFNGQPVYPEAVQALNRVQQIVDNISNLPDGAGLTPAAFDAMKRAVGGVVDGMEQGSNAQRVVRNVYDRIGRQIRVMVPEYDDVMRAYSQASDQIDDVRRTFSINPNSAPDTTARKLLSVTRNNVNTNYGERTRLADVLTQQPGAETLMPAIAGHAMSSPTPRGLQGLAASSAGIAGISNFANPLTLATLPLFSPRLVGETVYLSGQAAGTIAELAGRMGVTAEQLGRGLMESYALQNVTGPAKDESQQNQALGQALLKPPRN